MLYDIKLQRQYMSGNIINAVNEHKSQYSPMTA